MIPVRTKDFKESVPELCKDRNDDWALTVLARLEYARDIHAADAVYHQQCSVNFRTRKQIPQPYDDKEQCRTKKKRYGGRPHDIERSEAFLKVAQYLEVNWLNTWKKIMKSRSQLLTR